jgi:hypothetical protein
MPGLEHSVSEMTKRTDNDPYGCKDGKRKDGYWTYQRVYFGDGTYMMMQVYVNDVMSKECRYDMSLKDKRCSGCKHSGSDYDQMIRARGT